MKWFKVIALCMTMVLSMAGLGSSATFNINSLNVYDNMQLDSSDPNYIGYLIDIRTPEEWCGGDYWDPRPDKGGKNTDGHPGYDGTNGLFLDGRVLNISSHLFSTTGRDSNPWFEWEFQNRYSFVTDTPFALMCASGKRSYNAAGDLDALGFSWDIYNVLGGFKGRHDSSQYCPSGDCAGWKEDWTGFPNGLPRIDPGGYPCEGAYSPVPVPATMVLFSFGLIGLAGFRKKNRK